MSAYQKSRRFIYRNARPLDFARWQFHFEGGSKDAVLAALSAYQNDDGGFGHGLEADCFNPNSSPIQTWAAAEILHEIHFDDPSHPIVEGILRYLASGCCFDCEHRQWMNTVPENNDYPHAIWWTYQKDKAQFRYNPTAHLAGFFIRYADPRHEFYPTAIEIAKEAYRFWVSGMPYAEQHITACYIRLYEYCTEANVDIADMQEFRVRLIAQVQHELFGAANRWETEYVCMPSGFIRERDSMFFGSCAELVERECAFIRSRQLEDGSFPIPWQWWTEYPEFEVAKNWWKADFCIKNMLFLRAFLG